MAVRSLQIRGKLTTFIEIIKLRTKWCRGVRRHLSLVRDRAYAFSRCKDFLDCMTARKVWNPQDFPLLHSGEVRQARTIMAVFRIAKVLVPRTVIG